MGYRKLAARLIGITVVGLFALALVPTSGNAAFLPGADVSVETNKCKPSVEVCDGKDNDCDGKIDEDLKRACSSKCGKGQQTCAKGQWSDCSAPEPSPEVCDGKDNDCNGKVDDGASCPPQHGCHGGVCRQPCGKKGATCPKGQTCVNRYCYKK